MKTLHIVTAALVAALSGAGHAATLVSPPLTPGDGNSLLCQITNSSDQPRMVSIEVFGFCTSGCSGSGDGALINSVGPTPVGPLTTLSLSVADLATPPLTPHVCKFTVQSGKNKYRATACATSGPAPIACVPAN